jgi:hypothetical protein
LVSGHGVRNPATVTLAAGQQQARVIGDVFGLTSFDGWIEIESLAADLGVYAATGSADVTELDGIVPREPSSDFLVMHAGATLVMVNPFSRSATATIRDLVQGTTRTMEVPARSRVTTSITGISRVTSTEPLAAIEQFGTAGKLALAWAEPTANASTNIVLPHGAAGAGYVTTVTMANTMTFPFNATVRFASRSATIRLAANSVQSWSLADLFQFSPDVLVADAVRISAGGIAFGAGRLSAVVDIQNELSLATVASRIPSTELVFPHVANENGYLTGLCLASGDRGASITIDVFPASTGSAKSATLILAPNQQRAGWLQDLVPSVGGQTGGSIRIRSDEPIWACEIFRTDAIMASVPPL